VFAHQQMGFPQQLFFAYTNKPQRTDPNKEDYLFEPGLCSFNKVLQTTILTGIFPLLDDPVC